MTTTTENAGQTHQLSFRDVTTQDATLAHDGNLRVIRRRERTVTLFDPQAIDGLQLHHLRALLDRCEELGLPDFAAVKVTADQLDDRITVTATDTDQIVAAEEQQ